MSKIVRVKTFTNIDIPNFLVIFFFIIGKKIMRKFVLDFQVLDIKMLYLKA